MAEQVIPTLQEVTVSDFPQAIVPVDHVEPVPRRIRAVLDGRVVVDTTGARYVWEWPHYPQYYLPFDDVVPGALVDEAHEEHQRRGTAMRFGLRTDDGVRVGVAHHYVSSDIEGIAGMVRIDWAAMDAWFEEDEEVFVHPRSPYTRVDALRSDREVVVELGGRVLAHSSRPVLVFETGLPTRYYLDRLDVDITHLVPSGTVTACPYKGTTSAYWSVHVGDRLEPDLAWAYDFPTRQLLPIAGLVAFYNEKVDLTVDGVRLERPVAKFS
jgi:uncharacterized protein (DUF427 family)